MYIPFMYNHVMTIYKYLFAVHCSIANSYFTSQQSRFTSTSMHNRCSKYHFECDVSLYKYEQAHGNNEYSCVIKSHFLDQSCHHITLYDT